MIDTFHQFNTLGCTLVFLVKNYFYGRPTTHTHTTILSVENCINNSLFFVFNLEKEKKCVNMVFECTRKLNKIF